MSRVTVKPSPSVVRVVTECLCEVAERTGKEVGALEMAKWYEAFAVCQPSELREAFDNYALASPFAPSMAAIRQELDRSRFGGISGAWLMVREAALACADRNFFVIFEHAAIHFSIEVIGGWHSVIRLVRDPGSVSFARRDFMKAFEDHRPSISYPAGLGGFNGVNAVLIGHRERALEVYRHGAKRGAACFSGIDILQPQVELLPWQHLQDWPAHLGPEHMAAPPGPPVRITPTWWETEPSPSALPVTPA
ncbi:MAG: hypothetical protein QM788_14340 [Roseateles sp.]|uniref:hypothetical protein n=1 Tax=Roseateles sp. TaxID=1971397 RepID=UPI0039E7B1FE